MSKHIVVNNETHQLLIKISREKETFNQTILRLIQAYKDVE